ncbi:MAG: trehalose-6-phosphate synthase [Candidatus Omnitrophota bacterium]|nr:MAG: trehalose-6-phosphate synthase [Candidatus Omnitrophota bacterium]
MLRGWSKKTVVELVKSRLGEASFVVVSNRQPYIHKFIKGKIHCLRGPGGVITALDPVMKEIKGLWVCCGSGDADKIVAKDNKVNVPPEKPSYQVKYVWLTKEENLGYYYGFSNQALWPLSHLVFVKPIFREEDWKIYKGVNKKFAQSIYEEIKDKKAVVFIQDYHLTMVSKYLKEFKPDVVTILFWHIPWPTYDVFRILPCRQEFLEGLLSYDLLGFHIRYFCNNFFEAVANELESKINKETSTVIYQGKSTLVKAYPISIDFEGISTKSREKEVEEAMVSLKEEFSLEGYKIIVGLDRIDYTKGIIERILAIDKLLQLYPELKEKIIFIQMGEISRIHIAQYKQLNDQINALVEEVDFKHSTDSWRPIIFVRRHLSFSELLAFYRLANVCIVSSLHDGMNLVAKEFVSSRCDELGVLVLSKFTGAARELKEAVLINPYSQRESAEALFFALSMKEEEQKRRMRALRAYIQRNNIWRWIGKIVADIPWK